MSTLALRARGVARDASHAGRLNAWLNRLLVVAGLLLFCGLAVTFSTTVFLRIALERPPYDDFFRQLLFAGVGIVLAGGFIVLTRTFRPVRRWLRFVIPVVFFLSLLLVAMVKLSPLGVTVMGATRGLNVGLFTFQPSELLKLSLPLYLAQVLCWWRQQPRPDGDRDARGVSDSRVGVGGRITWPRRPAAGAIRPSGRPMWPDLPKRCWAAVLLAVGLTVIQPDLGTASVVLGSGIITMILAGVRWQSLVLFVAALCVVVLLVFAVAPSRFDYAFERLHTWMHPRADVEGEGYQITQSRGAIAAGRLFGRGFLKSEQKMNRLPLCTKDFVFPVIVEEMGYIGGMGVILLFVSLAWVGLRMSLLSRDPFNRTVIAALGLNVCLQGLVNIGTTTGALPLSGLTLPFFSEGGSSLVVSLCALGTMYALGLSELAQARAEGAPAAVGVPGGAPAPPLR